MERRTLSIVIFGEIKNADSLDLYSFWFNFIEIQNHISSETVIVDIAGHYYDHNFEDLVKLVYNPTAYSCTSSCVQQSCKENKQQKHYEMIMSLSESFHNAVGLLLDKKKPCDQILFCRWISSNKSSQKFLLDDGLPRDLIYIPYTSSIDEGYPLHWILAPTKLLKKFLRFHSFISNCVLGKNEILNNLLIKSGLRYKIIKIFKKLNWLSLTCQLKIYLKNKVDKIEKIIGRSNILSKALSSIATRISYQLSIPFTTAENSNHDRSLSSFSKLDDKSLNINILLKYFLYFSDLRNNIRFLQRDDFEKNEQFGKIINPQPIVLFLKECCEVSLKRVFEQSPMKIKCIYIIKADIIIRYSSVSKNLVKQTYHTNGFSFDDNFIQALQINEKLKTQNTSALVLNSVKDYLDCTDWAFLNALSKYVQWEKINFIDLIGNLKGKEKTDFPNLKKISQKVIIKSLVYSMGNSKTLLEFLIKHKIKDKNTIQLNKAVFSIDKRNLFLSNHK